MSSTIDPSSEQFLNAISRIQSRLDQAQRQISSGLRVSVASDAPDAVSPILQLHAQIQRNTEVQTELGRVKTEVDTGESSLSTAVSLMERASVLATQGASTAQTIDTRATLAQEVESLQEQMVAVSRTVVGGRFIFSGDSDQSPSYQIDLTLPDGVNRLQVSTETRLAQTPSGGTFTAALTANDIFDHRNADDTDANDNVFAALNGLRVALLANDQTAITTSISTLQTAATYLNNQLGFYGQVQGRISSCLTQAQNNGLQFQMQLSTEQDADSVAAIQELTMAQTQLQAAMQVRAKMPRTSLFDLL
jgi:flagellar hook-associated protein 3 FlgL